MHKNAHKKINNTAYKKWFLIYKSSSFKFSIATLTASTTKAVKVQSFPFIASSTSSIILLGNLMHLLVVGGIDGILNFFIISLLQYINMYNSICRKI